MNSHDLAFDLVFCARQLVLPYRAVFVLLPGFHVAHIIVMKLHLFLMGLINQSLNLLLLLNLYLFLDILLQRDNLDLVLLLDLDSLFDQFNFIVLIEALKLLSPRKLIEDVLKDPVLLLLLLEQDFNRHHIFGVLLSDVLGQHLQNRFVSFLDAKLTSVMGVKHSFVFFLKTNLVALNFN